MPDYYETYLENTVRPPVVAWVEVVVDAPHVEVHHVAKAVAAELVGVERRLEIKLHVVLLYEGRSHRLEVDVGHVLDDLHRMGITRAGGKGQGAGTGPVVNGQSIDERPRPRDNFPKKMSAVRGRAITVIFILNFATYRQII